jgi:hypothetical protein
MDRRAEGNDRLHHRHAFTLATEHEGKRAALALSDHDHDPALAGLFFGQPAIYAL